VSVNCQVSIGDDPLPTAFDNPAFDHPQDVVAVHWPIGEPAGFDGGVPLFHFGGSTSYCLLFRRNSYCILVERRNRSNGGKIETTNPHLL